MAPRGRSGLLDQIYLHCAWGNEVKARSLRRHPQSHRGLWKTRFGLLDARACKAPVGIKASHALAPDHPGHSAQAACTGEGELSILPVLVKAVGESRGGKQAGRRGP